MGTLLDDVDKNELELGSKRLLLFSSFMEATCNVAAGCKVAYEVAELEGVDEGLVVDAELVIVVETAALLAMSLSSKPPFM